MKHKALNDVNITIIREYINSSFWKLVILYRNDSNLVGVLEGGDMDQLWQKNMTSLADDEWKDVR